MTQYDDDLAELKLRMAESRRRRAGQFARRMTDLRAMADQATPIGHALTLSAVGPGWQVFSTRRDHVDGEAVGGTCLEVIHDRQVDEETGEVSEATRFRTLATWRPRPYALIDAGELDLDRLGGIDRRACAVGARWLVRPVANASHGLLDVDEVNALTDAWRLGAAAL